MLCYRQLAIDCRLRRVNRSGGAARRRRIRHRPAGTEQPLGATALATRLIAEIAKPFELDGHQVMINASRRHFRSRPATGSDPDKLLKSADMALYRAKNDGRDSYRFFEPDMDARMQLRRQLELDLRSALALGEFEVYLPALITLKTGKITGFEALLRWHHPERGMIPPMEFIPVAEEIGLIGQIGAWVLKQACLEAATWPDDIHIAVNLSPRSSSTGRSCSTSSPRSVHRVCRRTALR